MSARARPARAPEVPPICVAIAKARAEVGISQDELARRLKVGQTTVARWVGTVEPALDMVAAIERALGLGRGELLRAAGYVDDGHVSVRHAVANDHELDARSRRVLLATYRALVGS